MKTKLLILVAFAISCHAWADSTLDNAVSFYTQNFGHEHPDELMYTSVDFNADGVPKVLVASSYGYYDKMQGYTWTVLELRNGTWVQPKTQEMTGNVFKGAVISFDPWFTGFVFLKKYNRNGILTYFPKGKFWAFTYLDKPADILKTIHFDKASEVNMTEDALTALRDSGKLDLKRKQVE